MSAEWLEADGRGGFASGTASGIRTRRYHALLLHAQTPPTGRCVLVNGCEVAVETARGRWFISPQRYASDVTSEGGEHINAFTHLPWPQWHFRLPDGTELLHELFVPRGTSAVVLLWRLLSPGASIRIIVRPFLSGRDIHATHHENSAFRFDAQAEDGVVRWQPYPDVPGIVAFGNGRYQHEPLWYRSFQYDEERARGLDATEDLAAPGTFTFDLTRGEAKFALAAENGDAAALIGAGIDRLKHQEAERRARFGSRLAQAADAYVVQRGDGLSIIAGYPWFSDWGRDTFIALRGLCIAGGRLDDARRILLAWSTQVSGGMLPNYFPEAGQTPEFNSVDASLWFVVAVHDFLAAVASRGERLVAADHAALADAVKAILAGYAHGTRYGICADADGLLAAGQPGVQLTWMDARVGGREITPRIGKPVEVQALWINALRIGAAFDAEWQPLYERARDSFVQRFVAPAGLYDVVDVDHCAGAVDSSLRPNQLFAIGGLPYSVLDLNDARQLDIARGVVELVEQELWTPLGPRSLAPADPAYVARYEGGVAERDSAYHQGTVWPWVAGAFVEAWLRVRGSTAAARTEARERFLVPLIEHVNDTGLGHVSEIADAEPPHVPRGAPFQAWSLGELIRLIELVGQPAAAHRVRPKVPA